MLSPQSMTVNKKSWPILEEANRNMLRAVPYSFLII